jgi:hypothetical protein
MAGAGNHLRAFADIYIAPYRNITIKIQLFILQRKLGFKIRLSMIPQGKQEGYIQVIRPDLYAELLSENQRHLTLRGALSYCNLNAKQVCTTFQCYPQDFLSPSPKLIIWSWKGNPLAAFDQSGFNDFDFHCDGTPPQSASAQLPLPFQQGGHEYFPVVYLWERLSLEHRQLTALTVTNLVSVRSETNWSDVLIVFDLC